MIRKNSRWLSRVKRITKSIYRIEDQENNIVILDQKGQGEQNWDLKSARKSCKLLDQIFYCYFVTTVSVEWNPLD